MHLKMHTYNQLHLQYHHLHLLHTITTCVTRCVTQRVTQLNCNTTITQRTLCYTVSYTWCSVAVSGPATVFVARRKFESCAMMQVLRMCVSQEEMWAAPAIESAASGVSNLSVSERRMQLLGRTTLLKMERVGRGCDCQP